MRIIVTGGSGFIGTNIVEATHRSHEVLNLDVKAPPAPQHAAYWSDVDILDRSRLFEVFHEFSPDLVIHLAARTDLHGSTLDEYQANTRGVTNVVGATSSTPTVTRVIYASSRLVFAIDHKPTHDLDYKPSTPYGESKVVGEHIVLNQSPSNVEWCIVRPTSIWGPWFGTPYRDFFEAIRNRTYVRIPGHDPHKSYGYVGNSVHQLLVLAQADSATFHRKIFWLCDYEPLSLSEWAFMIAKELGVPSPRAIPYPILRVGAYAGDVAKRLGYKEPPITTFRLNNLLTEMTYDTQLTQAAVGPLPFGLQQGVQETVSWLKHHG